jgi:hypothetical protein
MLLGFFSFSKFLLWRDLKPESWDDGLLLGNGLLKQLLLRDFGDDEIVDTPLIAEDDRLDQVFRPAELIHVTDADSSQAIAIQEVLAGKNLVIQGPPGTGKSQTITNIVAGAVAGGLGLLGRAVRSPGSAVFGAIEYARSGRRMVRRAAEPSPLLRRTLEDRSRPQPGWICGCGAVGSLARQDSNCFHQSCIRPPGGDVPMGRRPQTPGNGGLESGDGDSLRAYAPAGAGGDHSRLLFGRIL